MSRYCLCKEERCPHLNPNIDDSDVLIGVCTRTWYWDIIKYMRVCPIDNKLIHQEEE